MSARALHRYTYGDYLALEASSNVKHEFLGGEIYAMAGGSPEHAAVAAAVIAALGPQLPPSCRVFTSDLRVRVRATGLATYPDVTVVCGPLERDPEGAHTVTNPRVLVEVLSPSTEDYDRGEKLAHYQQIPSLREVVLVSVDAARIEVHRRSEPGAWTTEVRGEGQVAALTSIGARLDVSAIAAAARGVG